MSEHEGLTLWLREGCTVASGQVVEFQAELCSWDSKQVRERVWSGSTSGDQSLTLD
jgi:hypothetical protein